MWPDTKVRDVVRTPLITVNVSDNVRYVAKVMVEKNISGVLVVDSGKPVGIVTERDLVAKILAQDKTPENVKAGDIMSTPLITVDIDKPLSEAVDLMNRKKVRRLLVTEQGKVVGIFTQRDVLALERVCGYCIKPIKPRLMSRPEEGEITVTCSCGVIYHLDCAKTVGYCLNCAQKIVAEIIYPRPEDTASG
ncbi:MAG: CBS domain-containing protein [Nitrososphaerota archaeon]